MLDFQNAHDNHLQVPYELQKVWIGNCHFWIASEQQVPFPYRYSLYLPP